MINSKKNNLMVGKKPIAQLEFAIQKADLNLIKNIFSEPLLTKDIDLSQISGPLSLACTYGHLDIVQYLMTLPDIEKHTDINSKNFLGFQMACINGWLEIVKYLTSSPNLKKHIEVETIHDIGFFNCLKNNQVDILRYFVFELNIEKNRTVNFHLRQHPNDEVEKMFAIREIHLQLEKEINSDKVIGSNAKLKI